MAQTGLTAERSREIQRELERIDANKAAGVDDFLTDWDRALNPAAYDIPHELRDVAMKAPAWQLYAASRTGDFETMVQILGGKRSAGRIINAIASRQRRVSATPFSAIRPRLLGSGSNELGYTPIAPAASSTPGPVRAAPGPAPAFWPPTRRVLLT